jgi:ATP-dependent exoDNAse (exonuclease V) alpha subunit
MFDLDSVPMDRTKKEHLGLLEKVVWSDDDRPVSILKLTDGKSVVVDAASTEFTRGQYYRFLGRWEEGRMGPQFKATTFVRDTPHTRTAVVKHLGDVCDGIGSKLANRLWELYGPDAVKTLREAPERVAGDGVMSVESATTAARGLMRYQFLEKTRIDLFGLLNGRGFPGKLVDHAISKWGVRAPEVIRVCPFRLLTSRLPGCGWKRCDKLHLDLGKPRGTLKRQALAGWNALREDRTGSTWVPAETVVKAIQDAVPGAAEPVKAVKLGIRGGLLRVRRNGDERWVAVAHHARAEQRIADAVKRLLAGPSQWPTDVPVSATEGDGLPSEHQAVQLRRATATALGCYTGGPGTGKTHSLSFVLREVIARHGPDAVAVCAPTGKAAVRATESLAARGVAVRATTIHQLLEIGRNGHDGAGWGFQRNRSNPLEQRFIVLDESSMIDTNLMADLLDACVSPNVLPAQAEVVVPAGGLVPPPCRRCGRPLTDPASWEIGYGPTCAKLVPESDYLRLLPRTATRETRIPALPEVVMPGTQILFVGDHFQLPPVGHGAPLRDLLAAGVAQGNLTEVRRNAGAIVRGCDAIKAGQRPVFCDTFDLGAGDPANLRFIECRPAETLDVIEKVLRSVTRFNPVWDAQILVATNDKSDVSRKAVNDRFAKVLNPDGRRVPAIPFAVGDKVICLKNSKLRPAAINSLFPTPAQVEDSANYQVASEGETFVANGEVARVAAVGPAGMVVAVGDKSVWVPKSKKRADDADEGEDSGGGAMGDWDSAWGITTHKSQGGEWPLVIVIADKAGGSVADTNWWYTAISRAKTACLVVGDRAAFDGQCRRQALTGRKTFLTELLKGG